MGTMVVRASEAMKIMQGFGDEFRSKHTKAAAENNEAKEAINVAFCRARARTKDLPNLRENLSFLPGTDFFYLFIYLFMNVYLEKHIQF